MSKRPRSIPVGILVSVGASRRRKRRFRSLDDDPPIKKEVNLPLRIGLGVGGFAVLALLVIVSIAWYGARQRSAPPVALAQPAPFFNAPAEEPPPMPALPVPPALEPTPVAPVAAPISELAVAAPLQQIAPIEHPPASPPPAACSNLGTQITFLSHPPDAFRQAARANKLVLMVHLSGNFEDQAFT
jgi:hypothetical protein